MGNVAFSVRQVHPAVADMPGNTVALQRCRPGNPEHMAEGAGLHPGKIVGRNLPGHVHGDKALEAQHHLMKGAVYIVDHVQMQTPFQHHGHAEHPLLRELGILRHFRHGQVAVHGNGAGAAGEHRGFEKIQLRFHQFL